MSLAPTDLATFHTELLAYLEELGIAEQCARLEADHIGMRFGKVEDVEALGQQLEGEGAVLLSDAEVNGRPIYNYQLATPLAFGAWQVPCIELPCPSPDHAYPEDGCEHVEFVIRATRPPQTIAEMRELVFATFPQLERVGILASPQYKETLPKGKEGELANPSIVFKKRQGLAIKFHPYSIAEIVTSA